MLKLKKLFKKSTCVLSLCLALCLVLGSCAGTKTVLFRLDKDAEPDVASLLNPVNIPISADAFKPESDFISKELFDWLYLLQKNDLLKYLKDAEEQGQPVTGDTGVKVADTEDFWGLEAFKDEDGTSVSFADYLYETVQSFVSVFKQLLALERIAADYGYVLPDNYFSGLDKAIAEKTAGADYLEKTEKPADEKSGLFGWELDRWKVSLAVRGIDESDWERLNYRFNFLPSALQEHLNGLGVLKLLTAEEAAKNLLEEKQMALKNFLETGVKFKYIVYALKTDEDFENQEDGQETGDEIPDDIAADNAEDYNRLLKEKCKKIYDGLLDGSLDFDEEAAKSLSAEDMKEMPDGVAIEADFYEYIFSESPKGCKAGDIKMIDTEPAVYILLFGKISEADYTGDKEPTEEEISSLVESSAADIFRQLVEKYADLVTFDESVLEKYKNPWEIK